MTSVRAVPFAMPEIGEEEIAAVADVLRSRWLTTGERCARFEREFATAVGARHAVALSSCTAALHLSLEGLGVRPGDAIFLSPYTFAATAEVVRYLGATPVFVDVDRATLNLDPALLSRRVVEVTAAGWLRPRAIMPVHIAGVPCDMHQIWQVADEHGLAVVEDAAHAFPADRDGHRVGRVPDSVRGTACFSFYATKTITTGEGGMLTTQDGDLADRARSMSLHGLSRQAWTRYAEGSSWAYDIVAPGFKYNLTDIAAALGSVQLRKAEPMRRRREQIASTYTEAFSSVELLECPTVPAGATSAWHLYLLRLRGGHHVSRRRQALIDGLTAAGIGTSVHFIPLHLHSYYRSTHGHAPSDFPVADAEHERVVSLPIYSAMDHDDASRVVEAVLDLTAVGTGARVDA